MNIVLDTNILLHYKSFEEIPWQEELGCKDVTIVLSAVVIEEIDRKKDDERGKIQKRAKSISSRIGELLLEGKECKYPVIFQETAYAQEEERRQYSLDRNDNQILFDVMKSSVDRADVTVVSNDTSMLIRAKKFGFRAHRLNDKYLLKEELSKEEKEAKAAVAELERLKSRRPSPQLEFDDGQNNIQFKKVSPVDFEEEVRRRVDDLRKQWPEKRLEDGEQVYMGRVFNPLTPEKVMVFNASRNKFIERSEQKIRLEVERDDLEQRMRKITIVVSNSGTASTGQMNVFLNVPKNVRVYEERSKKNVEYETPETPSFMPELTHYSFAGSRYGYRMPGVEMWDLKGYLRNNEFKQSLLPLTHNLQREVFSFYVDAATCPNFQMSWFIADAELADPVTGTLNVCFVE